MRARLAPRAARTAISLRRASVRARTRLATLAQAISRTHPTAPSSTSSAGRTSPTRSSCSGMTAAPQPLSSVGYWRREPRRDRVHLRAGAARAPTPGFRRASTRKSCMPRTARSSGCRTSGTHICVPGGIGHALRDDADDRVALSVDDERRRRRRTDCRRSGSSRAPRRARPRRVRARLRPGRRGGRARGWTPRTAKNSLETNPVAIDSGRPAPVTVTEPSVADRHPIEDVVLGLPVVVVGGRDREGLAARKDVLGRHVGHGDDAVRRRGTGAA